MEMYFCTSSDQSGCLIDFFSFHVLVKKNLQANGDFYCEVTDGNRPGSNLERYLPSS